MKKQPNFYRRRAPRLSTWPDLPLRKSVSAVKIFSVIALLLFIFSSSKVIAQSEPPPPSTEKIIQQAEYLFQAKVISVKTASDPQLYQIRLLQRSGNIILVTADKKTGEMTAINSPQQR
ncbi:hypothetical protein [Oceanicoccus sagamiensis]|uniref:PepSY domain-containing protein n=1 Tax=Oceanicoccus sagamiensis TaxID=716816 RepID=A0A1X9NEM9_9GAMM|nr:hypothetical protein [Oceanicoccus sagamiensis]ARN75514.1 hypothetical protein BST96_16210 [Oceanicoccus sagamiensis]